MSRADYRPFLPPPEHKSVADQTPRGHAHGRMQLPIVQGLFAAWAKLAGVPFRGMTVDGQVQPGLFKLQGEDAPTPAAVEAAKALIRQLSRPSAAPPALRSIPNCGGIGRTRKFTSSGMACGSTRRAPRSRTR